jgi:hypothetical protein
MDHSISTRWGGRAGRYAEFKGAVGRCFDPIARCPVEFEFAFEYEAWLRARLDPATASITHKRTPLQASRVDAAPLKAVATFVVTTRSGLKEFHLACRDLEAGRSQARALRKVAGSLGAKVVVHTLAELREDVQTFWRMELLRQAATIEQACPTSQAQVLAAAHAGGRSLHALQGRLPTLNAQQVNAALVRLHCAALLRLDLSHDDFGIEPVQGVLS